MTEKWLKKTRETENLKLKHENKTLKSAKNCEQ